MSYEGRPWDDDGRQDEGGEGGEVEGDIAKTKDAKTGAPAHRQDRHPPENISYTYLACDSVAP